MSAPLPPPGWHPDPQYPGYQRWWDGSQWTDHRAPLPAAQAGRAAWTGPPLAGFWPRVLAQVVDGFVIMIPTMIVVLAIGAGLVLATGSLFSSLDDVNGDTANGAAFAGLGAVIVGFLLLIVLVYLAQILYAMGFEGGRLGQTPGKWLVGIRVVDATTQQPTVPSKAFLRWVVEGLASSALVLGYLWMLWDDQNRTWHDMAADTRVVTVPEPRVPLRDLMRSWRLRADR